MSENTKIAKVRYLGHLISPARVVQFRFQRRSDETDRDQMAAGDNPRLVLGLKLRSFRQRRGETLKSLAERSGLSISYLSEIEKGKKYPKPERLLRLARAMEVDYDELVSLHLEEDLTPLQRAFDSPLVRGFPFGLFGLESEDVLSLVSGDPKRGSALLRAMVEVGRSYDVHVEHFLLAALRSYQQLHANYFEDLETEARTLRREIGVADDVVLTTGMLSTILRERWRVTVDQSSLSGSPLLSDLRSVLSPGRVSDTILMNPLLMESQKAFVLAREIGYRFLGLAERATTSPWLEVESFARVFSNFQASYFAGALLMDREEMRRDLERTFESSNWDGGMLIALMRRYRVTPESLLHRLTQIAPRFFGFRDFYFLRFNVAGSGPAAPVHLSKWLNTSEIPVPRGFGLNEHFCRRWPALRLLVDSVHRGAEPERPRVVARRIRFMDEQAEFLEISMSRPLALRADTLSAVSVGFLVDSNLRRRIRFVESPLLDREDVNLTCERCGLESCEERVAPAALFEARRLRREKAKALDELLS